MAPQESDDVANKVQALGDLELAVLICLIADQHCIIEVAGEVIEDVQEELKLVRRNLCSVLRRSLKYTGRIKCVRAHIGGARMRRAHHTRRLWRRHSGQGG